ncbi:hypothetical protein CVO76_08230, partial [Arthrobacter agilis]
MGSRRRRSGRPVASAERFAEREYTSAVDATESDGAAGLGLPLGLTDSTTEASLATLHTRAPAAPSTRSGAIDALRVLAVVAVVTGHVWAGPLIDAGLYTWHVPAFFVLSGYLWKNREPHLRGAVATEAKKRFRTIMTPYVAWLVLTLLVHVPLHIKRGTLTTDAVTLPLIGGSLNAGPFG